MPKKKKHQSVEVKFSVWVGGTEINDYYLSYSEAIRLKSVYLEKGYPAEEIGVERYVVD